MLLKHYILNCILYQRDRAGADTIACCCGLWTHSTIKLSHPAQVHCRQSIYSRYNSRFIFYSRLRSHWPHYTPLDQRLDAGHGNGWSGVFIFVYLSWITSFIGSSSPFTRHQHTADKCDWSHSFSVYPQFINIWLIGWSFLSHCCCNQRNNNLLDFKNWPVENFMCVNQLEGVPKKSTMFDKLPSKSANMRDFFLGRPLGQNLHRQLSDYCCLWTELETIEISFYRGLILSWLSFYNFDPNDTWNVEGRVLRPGHCYCSQARQCVRAQCAV